MITTLKTIKTMTFVSHGLQAHREERTDAFELMLPTGAFLSLIWLERTSDFDAAFAFRKHPQCGLAAAMDENLHNLLPATRHVTNQYKDCVHVNRALQTLVHCHASVVR